MAGDTAPILLLSMPQMADPNFARTVILLCDYTEDGAFGLVVNRQMSEPAWTMIRTRPSVEVNRDVRLWLGGPVDPQRAWVLMDGPQGPDEEQLQIAPGLILSASQALTLEMLRTPPTRHARVIVGYAGWGPGQLEREIAASGWLTMEVDPALILGVPPDDMWEAAIRRLGTDPAALQASPGVH
jgi:putative transcriptional regulator